MTVLTKPPVEITPQLEAKFWANVVKQTNGCWVWVRSTNTSGYGVLCTHGDESVLTHRFSWQLHFGHIPFGLYVLHHCDIRICVRPDHLFLGTFKDNRQDCVFKGRDHAVRGEQHGTHVHPESLKRMFSVFGVESSLLRSWLLSCRSHRRRSTRC